jgi:hypothetical protein
MPLIHYNHVIDQVTAAVANTALGNALAEEDEKPVEP